VSKVSVKPSQVVGVDLGQGCDIGTVVLELQIDLIDSITRFAEQNELDPSDFLSIILAHHFHRGISIGYLIDNQMYSLDVKHDSSDKAMPSPQGMVEPRGH